MLKRINRLQSPELFKDVFKTGNQITNKLFWIIYKKNNLSYPRIGIIVSKKISKLATTRNNLKRKIRNSARELLPYLIKNLDLIIVAKKPILNTKFVDIKESLGNMFKKII